MTEQDGSPLKLGHIPSNEAEEETGGTLIFATRKPRISKYLKGKEKEWARAVEKRGPLQLLDLPVDVLKEIIKEVHRCRKSMWFM